MALKKKTAVKAKSVKSKTAKAAVKKPVRKVAVKKAVGKKPVAKKIVKKPVAKKAVAAKKPAAKKSVVKKVVAKKSAAKAVATKKHVVKKPVAKKTVAKKVAVKKSVIKKVAVKKTVAKKTVVKKVVVKKPVAVKKAAPKAVVVKKPAAIKKVASKKPALRVAPASVVTIEAVESASPIVLVQDNVAADVAPQAAAVEAPAVAAIPDTPVTPLGIPEQMRDTALKVLDERQAEDIVTVSLAGRSAVADYMIIASGRASRQVSAIADYLRDAFYKLGCKQVRVEGMTEANWVLIDGGDVIVHLFRPEVRSYYDLDSIWNAPHSIQTKRPRA